MITGFTALASAAHAGDDYDAGYEWAEYQSIDDPARCYEMDGKAIDDSPAFTAGCLQYLHDHGITQQDPAHSSDDRETDPPDGG